MSLDLELCPRINIGGAASLVLMDLDNCLKVALDALQGVVLLNDRQVRAIRLGYGAPTEEGSLLVDVAEFVPEPPPLFAVR